MTPESAYQAVRETAGYWDESGRARIRVNKAPAGILVSPTRSVRVVARQLSQA